MTNKRVHRSIGTTCTVRLYRGCRSDAADTIADEPDRPPGGTYLARFCDADERAAPLPHWMRTTRPSVAGMFVPGPLIALAVMTVPAFVERHITVAPEV